LYQAKIDKVACLGTSLGLASFFFLSYLTYRPNRLSSGIGLSIWEAIPNVETGVFLSLLVLMLVLSFIKGSHNGLNALSGLAAGTVIVITFWFAGEAALSMTSPENAIARFSLGAGAWSIAVAAYIVLFASIKQLESRILKLAVSATGPILLLFFISNGSLNELSIAKELLSRKERFVLELYQHISLAGLAVGLGTILGVPLGILAFRIKTAGKFVFFIANTVQTVPSLALFGLMIAPLALLSEAFPLLRQFGIKGIGWTPALIALTLYSLLPIIRNAYTSLNIIDYSIIDAGLGMGMSRQQLLFKVEIPLALPIILSGIRTATVQSIGNTTVAALIGAGGLGIFVFQGLGQAAPDLILLGAIPVIILALSADLIMQGIIIMATPKGISGGQK